MEFVYSFCVAGTKGHMDRYWSTARDLGTAAIGHQSVEAHRDKQRETRCYAPQQTQAWTA